MNSVTQHGYFTSSHHRRLPGVVGTYLPFLSEPDTIGSGFEQLGDVDVKVEGPVLLGQTRDRLDKVMDLSNGRRITVGPERCILLLDLLRPVAGTMSEK